MGLKDDQKLCEQMFTETHESGSQADPGFVTRAELDTMLKGMIDTPKAEAVTPIGLNTECPHCHKTIELDGIDGDEMFKALNQTLGTVLERLDGVEQMVSLNETIVKGIAGFKRLGESLMEEVEELKKGFSGGARVPVVEPEAEADDDGEDPVAKGVMAGFSPRQQKAVDKLGDLTKGEFQEAVRKAVEAGKVPAETAAFACSCSTITDLISDPNILKVLETIGS
jgi:hypothetical protein